MARRLPPLALPDDQHDREELRELLQTLGQDATASAARIALCEAVAAGLAHAGQLLWVVGSIVGPHGVSGESPHGFGDDRIVGLATVAQIGGRARLHRSVAMR